MVGGFVGFGLGGFDRARHVGAQGRAAAAHGGMPEAQQAYLRRFVCFEGCTNLLRHLDHPPGRRKQRFARYPQEHMFPSNKNNVESNAHLWFP